MGKPRRGRVYLNYRRCTRSSCQHAETRHGDGGCACGCPEFTRKLPHWWHEYVCDTYISARIAWEAQAESETKGYETEMREYREHHPSPKFRDFLVTLRFKDQEELLGNP